MNKILVAIIVVVILLIGPAACEVCSDVMPYFAIKGLQIKNLKFGEGRENEIKVVEKGESIQWGDYLMRVNFNTEYISARYQTGARLLADCDYNGYSGTKVGLDTMYVVALTPYNDSFATFDTLNSILLVNDLIYLREDFTSLESYIIENRERVKREYFDLKFSESPSASESEYQFELIYVLANGETFSGNTDVVKLTK